MTRRDFDMVFELQTQINELTELRAEMASKLDVKSSWKTDQIRVDGESQTDKFDCVGAALIDIDDTISKVRRDLARRKQMIENFIDSVPDIMTRLPMRYRYLAGMQWGDVASSISRTTSADSVKKRVYRYFNAAGIRYDDDYDDDKVKRGSNGKAKMPKRTSIREE